MTSDWNSGNVFLKWTNFCVYIFSRTSWILVDFTKLDHAKFSIYICSKNVDYFSFFLESIKNNSFSTATCLSFRYHAVFRISFHSTVFFLFFFIWGWSLSSRRFQKLAICKHKYSWSMIFSARKNKYTRKLVCLRYTMFMSELSPLSFPSSDNT